MSARPNIATEPSSAPNAVSSNEAFFPSAVRAACMATASSARRESFLTDPSGCVSVSQATRRACPRTRITSSIW